MGACLCIFC